MVGLATAINILNILFTTSMKMVARVLDERILTMQVEPEVFHVGGRALKMRPEVAPIITTQIMTDAMSLTTLIEVRVIRVTLITTVR